ncbi:MAG: ROK family protein [Clostridia bacterium]|nr:ROK family protein [Clostridia bacterium]
MKFIPKFDNNFNPISMQLRDFREKVTHSESKILSLCVERNDGYNYIKHIDIFAKKDKFDVNYKMVERIVKSMLWIAGGYKIFIKGDKDIFEKLKQEYSLGGKRAFDVDFMQTVYEKPFEVIYCEGEEFPTDKPCQVKIGGHLNGCRIGFDAGGSDRKVSAVIDGEVVYSEEVIWHPKKQEDYNYHYAEILTAMKTAASKMPRVDAIGVSSAGVYVNNKIMVASLFMKVPKEDHKEHVQPMYLNVAKEIGAPIEVANDGDVTALAGALDLKDTCVLGIAMGTSEAVGYINDKGLLNGWLSEVAFVPVDFNENAMVDEWSGDYGCGVKYFSQDGVIKLAESAGYKFKEGSTPAEKLVAIQDLMKEDSPLARQIYQDIGVYLGYCIPYYAEFYDIKHLLLLGRVTSGKGGDIIIEKAKQVLKEEFPEFSNINLTMPNEWMKRVGQSIAAASLVDIN